MLISWGKFKREYWAEGKPLVKGGKYTNSKNLECVTTLARHHNGKPLAEIGTAHGHTSIALATTCPDSEVWTFDVCRELVDVSNSPFDHEIMERERVGAAIAGQDASIRERINLTVARPSFLRTEIYTRRPYSFVFVDGDHTWRNVIEDTKVAVNSLAVGGTLVWDDYPACPEVKAFIDIVSNRCGGVITYVKDTRICFLRFEEPTFDRIREAMNGL